MLIALYMLLVIGVGSYSLARGFRWGITRQLATLLGCAFGAVGSRILTPEFYMSFLWVKNIIPATEFVKSGACLLCGAVIYSVIYWLFSLLSGLLRGVMAVFEVGMFNRLLGAFFCCIKNLLWVSIFFNLLLCFSSSSELLQFERANDGNLVGAVMSMTPAILGIPGAADFSHIEQLREAKKISCNFNGTGSVIWIEGFKEEMGNKKPGTTC